MYILLNKMLYYHNILPKQVYLTYHFLSGTCFNKEYKLTLLFKTGLRWKIVE